MNGFAQRLTQLRESKDLKKNQLSKILNVSDACISQYENGSSMPGCDILLRISQYFGVSIDFLLGNDGGDFAFPLDGEFSNNVDYYTLLTLCSKLSPLKSKALLTMVEALLEE